MYRRYPSRPRRKGLHELSQRQCHEISLASPLQKEALGGFKKSAVLSEPPNKGDGRL